MRTTPMFINGEWVYSSGEGSLPFHDASSGQVMGQVPSATEDDVDRAVDAARAAFDREDWRRLTPADRSNILLKIADTIEKEAGKFARMESANTGKSIKQTTNYDIPYLIDNTRFIAGACRNLEGKAMTEYVSEGTSGIRREPIGVVAVITPWNYPLMLVVWRAFPALAMGNTVVLKPATYTPLTSIELAKLVQKVGLPKGAFNVITGPGTKVGESLARHSKVDMIAFTGSTEVGRRLSELGSGTVKKVSLELGGKAPFIVFDDANLEAAAEGAVVGGLVNNGEDCANSTRYYVHESVIKKYQDILLRKLRKVRVGEALNPTTDMGPLISEEHRKRVEGYIEKGIEEGGKLLHGGKRPSIRGYENGYFLEPTVVYTENNDSTIVTEEVFGPVFALLPFSSYKGVIERSNDVIYGLCSSVWTKDVTTAMNAVKDLRFGTVWVNEHVPVPSEMPWAAYKQSGHGASMSAYGLEEYSNIKHVYFDLTGKERKSWYYQVYGDRE